MKSINTMILVCILVATSAKVKAQANGPEYNTAIGFKFSPAAITLKHFVRNNGAIEGLGYFWDDGFRLTGLYEWHGDFAGATGLKWYAGGGAHLDIWDDGYKRRNSSDGAAGLGLDGVIGLDFKFNGAPINLSLDWQPSITFIGGNYTNASWVGIAMRFAF